MTENVRVVREQRGLETKLNVLLIDETYIYMHTQR